MMEWTDHIVFWHWWILAGLILILELTAPAFFFLWIGIAAAAVGFLLLVFPELTLQTQLVLFGAFCVVAVVAWRRYREKQPTPTDQPNLNRRGQQYVGRTFTLSQPIVNGVGRVIVDDSRWRIKGPDLDAGHRVRVVDIDGTSFIVEDAGTGD